MDCNDFRGRLYHFQADELTAAERDACQQHLDGCAGCADRLEVEESLLRAVRARLAAAPAPPGLDTRVRARLRDARRPRPGLQWVRQPWFAAVAASLLLALLLFPYPASREPAPGPGEITSREVTLVDHECDRAGRSHQQQRSCRNPEHLNALRLGAGRYWHISADRDLGRELATGREIRGSRMLVEGRFFASIRTLQIERAVTLQPGSAGRT